MGTDQKGAADHTDAAGDLFRIANNLLVLLKGREQNILKQSQIEFRPHHCCWCFY